MKTKFLFFMIAGLAIALFSCKSDNDTSSINEELNDRGIYIPRIENNPNFEIILNVCEKEPWTWYYLDNELAKIKTLFGLIPDSIKTEYDKKYLEWEKTWAERPLAYNSNPRIFSTPAEYKELLKYCEQYGKSMWAVVFANFATKSIAGERPLFMSNLWIDLTFSEEYEMLFDYIHWYFLLKPLPYYEGKTDGFYIGTTNVWVVYSRNLLKLEYDNILQSIKDNFYPEEGSN